MTHRRTQHRGMTIVYVMMLVAFLGVAMLAMAVQVRTDYQVTRREQQDAQLWQMLAAGQVVAHASPTKEARVPLPADLARDGATLIVTPTDAGSDTRQVVTVTATCPPACAKQTLTYKRANIDADWQLVDVVFERLTNVRNPQP